MLCLIPHCMSQPHYRKTQKGYLQYVFGAIAIIHLILLAFLYDKPAVWSLLAMFIYFSTVPLFWSTMTVTCDGEYLGACFGPVRLCRRSVRLSQISEISPYRTRCHDTPGLHYRYGCCGVPRGFSAILCGKDAVQCTLKTDEGRKPEVFIVGTNDLEELCNHLNSHIQPYELEAASKPSEDA